MGKMTNRPTRQGQPAPYKAVKRPPRVYRGIVHPKHTFRDVIAWMAKGHDHVRSRDIALGLGMTPADAGMRMHRLVLFGLVKRRLIRTKTKQGHSYEYDLTHWGHRYARDQKLV